MTNIWQISHSIEQTNERKKNLSKTAIIQMTNVWQINTLTNKSINISITKLFNPLKQIWQIKLPKTCFNHSTTPPLKLWQINGAKKQIKLKTRPQSKLWQLQTQNTCKATLDHNKNSVKSTLNTLEKT